jgi:hypothetical protein
MRVFTPCRMVHNDVGNWNRSHGILNDGVWRDRMLQRCDQSPSTGCAEWGQHVRRDGMP